MYSESLAPGRARPVTRSLTIPLGGMWHRVALLLIVALSAVLNFAGLSREGYSNTFYAAAVRSMSENWHNFWFNSFDPGGFVTIDKPPLGFWFQVASVKIFGFNGVALLLPEALAGVLAVLFLYRLVARSFGRVAGLVAALVLAVTPISVVTNRNNTIDSILVVFVLAAVWAVLRAAESGKLRWLLLSAVCVGLGFNVKMLEAYLVVPALGLVYLLGAHISLKRRLAHLLTAAVVLVAVSLSWVTAVDLTPASQRPWIDSTTTNSALDLAIGYNGLDRLTGNTQVGGPGNRGSSGGAPNSFQVTHRSALSGATTSSAGGTASTGTARSGSSSQSPTSAVTGQNVVGTGSTNSFAGPGGPNGQRGPGGNGGPGGAGGGPGGIGENGPTGPLRLLDTQLGSQIGWFLPLAVIGLVFGLWQSGLRRRLLDDRQRSLVVWGMWLLTAGGFFSIALFYHTYYLTMLAPAVAALAGIAVSVLWQTYRRADSRTWWMLPLSLLAVAGVQAYILTSYPSWSRWLTPLIVAATLIAAAGLVLARIRPARLTRIGVIVAAIGVLGLATPAGTFAAYTMQHTETGNIVRAGPSASGTRNGFGGPPGGQGLTPGQFGSTSGGVSGTGPSASGTGSGTTSGTTRSSSSAPPASGSGSRAPSGTPVNPRTGQTTPPGGSGNGAPSGATSGSAQGTLPSGASGQGFPGGPPSGSGQGFQGGPPPGGFGNGTPPGPPPTGAGNSSRQGAPTTAGSPPSGTGSNATAPRTGAGTSSGGGTGAGSNTGSSGSSSNGGSVNGAPSNPPSGTNGGFPFGNGRPGQGGFGGGGPGGGNVSSALISYLIKHRNGARFLVATTSSQDAAPIIIRTGQAVMSMGGFTGSDPILTVAKLKTLINNNSIHYFLLGGRGGPGGGNSSVTSWIESHCTVVPATKYSSTSSASSGFGGGETLYYCGAAK